MIQYFSKAISSAAISYGIVAEEDRELYEYSFLIMLEQVSIGLSILFIALFFGVFFETVLYMVLFIPLRIYAGGYHARSFSWCYIISVGVYLTYVILQSTIVISNVVIFFVALTSCIVILRLAPMADPNKQVDILEKGKFKKRVRIILIIEMVLLLLSLLTTNAIIIAFVGFVFSHLALLLLAGRLVFKSNRLKSMYVSCDYTDMDSGISRSYSDDVVELDPTYKIHSTIETYDLFYSGTELECTAYVDVGAVGEIVGGEWFGSDTVTIPQDKTSGSL